MEQLVEKWFEELRRIWIKKDLENVPNLLAENFLYYESPFELPLTTTDAVKKEWEPVKGQIISQLDIHPIFLAGNRGVATYTLILGEAGKQQISSGVYFVEINNKGKATLFRQWWMSK